MALETIFQNELLTQFAYPFLLIFFIVFAILEKTGVLGEGKTQVNALVAFVIGLIFISAVKPKLIVGDLILFLTVAMVVMFVGLLLWGFISGGKLGENLLKEGALQWIAGIVVTLSVIIAIFWATGTGGSVVDLLFKQSWSDGFWTNFFFMVVLAGALAVVWKTSSGSE